MQPDDRQRPLTELPRTEVRPISIRHKNLSFGKKLQYCARLQRLIPVGHQKAEHRKPDQNKCKYMFFINFADLVFHDGSLSDVFFMPPQLNPKKNKYKSVGNSCLNRGFSPFTEGSGYWGMSCGRRVRYPLTKGDPPHAASPTIDHGKHASERLTARLFATL